MSQLKDATKRLRPQPSAAEVVECIQTQDLGTKDGKSSLWRVFSRLPTFHKSEYQRLRDLYLEQRFHVRDANRMAALDVAATLPTAHELPKGLLDSLRTADGGPAVPVGAAVEPACALPEASGLSASGLAQAGLSACNAQAGLTVAEEVEGPPAPKKRPVTQETRFDRLLRQVRGNSGSRGGIGRSVAWVSGNLRTPLEQLDPESVPGVEALSLWMWARQNETEYRRLYDCKRIPSRGIAEDASKGFIDSGDPIEDIISRIRQVGQDGDSHVPMRHLQAADSDGNDAGPQGGLHDLPECSAERCEGGDSRDGRPGGGVDGEPGVDIPGPVPGPVCVPACAAHADRQRTGRPDTGTGGAEAGSGAAL